MPRRLLTVTAPSGTPSGNYNVLVTGQDASGMYIHTLAITAMVSGASGAQGFTIASSQNINIAPGATSGNTSTISVNPTNGFTGNVAVSCAVTAAPSGAISPVTCSIPSPINITGAAAVSSTLTVGSTATTSSRQLRHHRYRHVRQHYSNNNCQCRGCSSHVRINRQPD